MIDVKSDDGVEGEAQGKGSDYGPWMLVERRTRRGQQFSQANDTAKSRKETLGTKYTTLIEEEDMVDDLGGDDQNFGADLATSNKGRSLVKQDFRVKLRKDTLGKDTVDFIPKQINGLLRIMV